MSKLRQFQILSGLSDLIVSKLCFLCGHAEIRHMAEPPVFVLSPARCDGRRAQMLINQNAEFPLAARLRGGPQPIGEVFAFLSGLYFRGKLAYAVAFGRHTADHPGIFVITTNRGLVGPETPVSLDDLRSFASVDLERVGDSFREPLRRDARRLQTAIDADRCVVLLGSIATGKYADSLIEVFGERLLFPSEFVGRGDMSRGGLMLRQVAAGRELTYVPVAGAVRRGKRPPKLR
jgi:hypothetical protein